MRPKKLAGRVLLLIAAVSLLIVPMAPSASAGTIACTGVAIDGNPGHYINCTLDVIGSCTVTYDPLIDGNDPLQQTIQFIDCLA